MTYWIDAASWLLIAIALSYLTVRVVQTLPLPHRRRRR